MRGLSKRYGSVQALKGVDLEVGEGELVGLLGPNGAGKSTLVKIAVGLVRPSGGEASIAGAPAGSLAARRALGYLAEMFRFPGWYTADEVLELHQRLAGSRAARPSGSGCSSSSRSPTRPTAASTACRKGCSSDSASRRRSSASRACCSSTSRRRRSTRSAAARCACSSRSCAAAACRCSSTRTSCPRSSSSATASPSSSAGELVAAGSPHDLSRPRGVELETDEGVVRIEGATREDAPRLVAEAVAAGRQVYGVRVLTSTLEEVYLEAVGGETS